MKSKVITIRVSKELEERMRRIDINWSEEIRRFIEARVRSYELLETIRKIRVKARGRKVSVDSTSIIREDRDSR